MDLLDGNRRLSTWGIVYITNKEKVIECYIYAVSGWAQADADNAENFMSCTVYVITYGLCPLLWCINLHKEIALSTTEAEYIELIQTIWDVISFMELMK